MPGWARRRVPDRTSGGHAGVGGKGPAGRCALPCGIPIRGENALSRRPSPARPRTAPSRCSFGVRDSHRRRRDNGGWRKRRRRGLRNGCLTGALGCRGRRRQQGKRVAVGMAAAGLAHPEMQVGWLGRPRSRRADGTDPFTGRHGLAFLHRRGGEMKVGRVKAVERTDAEREPRRAGGTGEADGAAHGRHHRLPGFPRNVDAAVLAARVGVVTVGVRSDDLAAQRPYPGGRRGRREGEEGEGSGRECEMEAIHAGDGKADSSARGQAGTELSQSVADL
jgi:hypothetical protein